MAAAIERTGIRTIGIHRATLTTTDLARARVFYIVRLGFPLIEDDVDRFVFGVAQDAVTVVAAADAGGAAHTRALGVECIALGCDGAESLRDAANALGAIGIEHSGVRVDTRNGTEYVAFSDPDGIAWKLCMI